METLEEQLQTAVQSQQQRTESSDFRLTRLISVSETMHRETAITTY